MSKSELSAAWGRDRAGDQSDMLTYADALSCCWDAVRVLELCASADFSAEYHKHLGAMFHEAHANLIGAASR